MGRNHRAWRHERITVILYAAAMAALLVAVLAASGLFIGWVIYG